MVSFSADSGGNDPENSRRVARRDEAIVIDESEHSLSEMMASKHINTVVSPAV